MNVTGFLASLNEASHGALVNAIVVGLVDARMVAQCLAGPRDQHTETTTQLLAYLARSIGRLERARRLIAERIEA